MKERDCGNCIWHTGDGCTSWECQYVSRKYIRSLIDTGELELPEEIEPTEEACLWAR